MLHILIKNLLS